MTVSIPQCMCGHVCKCMHYMEKYSTKVVCALTMDPFLQVAVVSLWSCLDPS